MDGSLSREVYISSNYGTRITDISFLEFFSLSNSPKKGDHLQQQICDALIAANSEQLSTKRKDEKSRT